MVVHYNLHLSLVSIVWKEAIHLEDVELDCTICLKAL